MMHNSITDSIFLSQELEAEMENVWKKQIHTFKQKYESLRLNRETLVDRGQDMITRDEDTSSLS